MRRSFATLGLGALLCTSCATVYTFDEACGSGCRAGHIGAYSASETDWASNGSAVTFDLGTFPGGASIVIGTCGLPGAEATGRTFLRLQDPAIAGETMVIHGHADDCAGTPGSPNRGDRIWYVVPTTTRLTVNAGCVGHEACSGEIAMFAVLDANGEAFDVPAAFDHVRGHGEASGLWEGHAGWFREIRRRTHDERHFQGMQRLRSTWSVGVRNVLDFYDGAVSAYAAFSSSRHLWIGRVTADVDHRANLPWNGNLDPDLHPYFGHEFYLRLSHSDIGTPHDHLGGIQVSGNVLFIPASGETSEIIAVDVGTAQHPTVLYTVDRQGLGGAAAVGVTHRRHGTWGYLMAVCKSAPGDLGLVDFYVKDHDGNNYATIRENEVIPWRLIRSDLSLPSYQACNLVTSRNGVVYLVGMMRREGWRTDRGGDDYADLYRIERLCPECADPEDVVSLSLLTEKRMHCSASGEDWCSLKAASGIYVNPASARRSENALLIYGAHYRHQRIRRRTFAPFMEFNAGPW